jgi:hypothetical protein
VCLKDRFHCIADMRKIGPHSRPAKLQIVDGRRAEAKLLRDVRDELTKHCGGLPSATQRMIINQAAMLTLRLHLMDRQSLRDEGVSERNGRQYLAWSAALTRLLRQLGLKGAVDRAQSLQELIDAPAPAAPSRRPAAAVW